MSFLQKKKHVPNKTELGEKIMINSDFLIKICIFRKHEF
jgi:hypothetical protein